MQRRTGAEASDEENLEARFGGDASRENVVDGDALNDPGLIEKCTERLGR